MKKSEFTRAKSEQCAKQIIDLIIKENLWGDVRVYANGKVWSNQNPVDKHYHYEQSWDSVFCLGEADPKDYIEYTSDFLTMTFESDLYDVLNFYWGYKAYDRVHDGINDILRKYGKYLELGYSWSLAAYDI